MQFYAILIGTLDVMIKGLSLLKDHHLEVSRRNVGSRLSGQRYTISVRLYSWIVKGCKTARVHVYTAFGAPVENHHLLFKSFVAKRALATDSAAMDFETMICQWA
jgi:hypothetical protein